MINGATAMIQTGQVPDSSHGSSERTASSDPLRARPADGALAWVATTIGATSIDSVQWMPGGSSASMHRLTVSDNADNSRTVILRRWVRPESIVEAPDIAIGEAAVLELVATMSGPTPRLLGCDPTGVDSGYRRW